MPANLTPDYLAAEREYKQARTPEDRLAALRRMIATLPKHKGTEKIQADLRHRLSKLADEVQSQAHKKGFAIRVEKEGAGQVVVCGAPNSGKSALVAALTGVDLAVAPHPYTTRSPHPAMMPFEDVKIQLVDLPPISSAHVEPWLPNILRTCDAALLVADLAAPSVLEELQDVQATVLDKKVRLVARDAGDDPWASVAEKPTLLVGTKVDVAGAREAWELVRELVSERYEGIAVSVESAEGLEPLREAIFRMLRVVRVYSKPPHHEADRRKPFVLPEGSHLLDFAGTVHHDFADRLAFARVWGPGKFDGQRVNKDYVLVDGDVIELHA